MRLIIQPDYQSVSQWAAHYVAAKIKAANPTPQKPFVLGCPTGSSPLGMYKALIDLNKKGIVSFQNVVTFNMDEYVGLPKEHPDNAGQSGEKSEYPGGRSSGCNPRIRNSASKIRSYQRQCTDRHN